MKKLILLFAFLGFLFSPVQVFAACGAELYPKDEELNKNANFSSYLLSVDQAAGGLYFHGVVDDSSGNLKLRSFYSARDIWNSAYTQYKNTLSSFTTALDNALHSPASDFNSFCDQASFAGNAFSKVRFALLQQDAPVRKSITDLVQRAKSTNDPFSSNQYYLNLAKLDQVYTQDLDKSVTVAIIDDGIYVNHPDLKENIWINKNEVIGNDLDDDGNGYVDDIYGYDFVGNTDEMTVRGSHGTAVAGIIGAVSENKIGIQGIVKNVKLMSLIVCDSKTGCLAESVAKAIHYAVDNGASIINLSIGTVGTTSYTNQYNEAVRYAFGKGVLIVAAAGNGDTEGGIGQDLDMIPQSPVRNDNSQNMVLGVGAVDAFAYRTSWSNYGLNCVDVSAPGSEIFSTTVPAYEAGQFYRWHDGTSFSAPIVTAIAALIKQKHPAITPVEIMDLIKTTRWQSIIDATAALNKPYNAQVIQNPPSSHVLDQLNAVESVKDDFVHDQIRRLVNADAKLVARLKGYILLQTQTRGAAWYLDPATLKRYYMRDGSTAYQMLRAFGLGVSEQDFAKLQAGNVSALTRLKGRIVLRVQAHGEAYYISPKDLKLVYLKDGEAAYAAMRGLSQGISDVDIAKIPIAEFVAK